MAINLDVANTCFWRPMQLNNMIVNKFRKRNIQEVAVELRPVEDTGLMGGKKASRLWPMLKQFKKLKVTPIYEGCPCKGQEFVIKEFIMGNAKEYKMDFKDGKTGKSTNMSIFDYFRRKYNVTLIHHNLPLVQMTKKGVLYPVEVLYLVTNQKYNYRLDELQTASMIKFAVSRPNVRMGAINEGKAWLDWDNDRPMKAFGLQIEGKMIRSKARLLPNPKIQFGGSTVDPGTSGRWDLRGKKFFTPNTHALQSWGVGVFEGRTKYEKHHIDLFIQNFVKIYRQHGGKITTEVPNIVTLNPDAGKAVEQLYQSTGNKFQMRPQIMIFIVQNREAFHYLRIKKSCDCRYGIVSQVLQLGHIIKNNPQYHSNILMKVNAKLGGCTSAAISHPTSGFKKFVEPTMIIGADVSHASPGSEQPSTAALTVSMDKHAGRYAAAVQTNGHRVEMIAENNFRSMFGPIATQWTNTVGAGVTPKRVYYIRDGVSEGQYQDVLQQEVPRIKSVLTEIAKKDWQGLITVVIASKRHHIRAYPNPKDKNSADKNGNPLPGVVIERDCTTPHDWDFYLYSHIALQGTSRPVHYSVIRDDMDHKPEFLMNMIYEHCYQYMRSTTSVSLHPAVYYAHLASIRAKSHENIAASEGPTGGPGFKMTTKKTTDAPPPTEVKPLIPLFQQTGIHHSMWYI